MRETERERGHLASERERGHRYRDLAARCPLSLSEKQSGEEASVDEVMKSMQPTPLVTQMLVFKRESSFKHESSAVRSLCSSVRVSVSIRQHTSAHVMLRVTPTQL